MNNSILSKIIFGYEEIEPCIIAALALKRNIAIIGPHGVGKTQISKLLAKAVDETGCGFRYFSADKAGMIHIGGFPDMEKSSKSGRFELIKTDRSIFGGKVIVIDELPRADKERQNYWLEVLEEGTFQGIPIAYDMAIATGNDSTYTGNFKLDLALKSRFLFWLPAPSFKQVESNDVIEMIKLNIEDSGDRLNEAAVELRDLLVEIRKLMKKYEKDKKLTEQLQMFIGTFTQFLKDKVATNAKLSENPESYVSPREFANQMYYGMIGLGAYFAAIGYSNPFQHAGKYVVKYTIETRHAAAGVEIVNICNLAWKQLSNMLIDGVDTPEGSLKWRFACAINANQKIEFWKQYLDEATKVLSDADLTNMSGDTVQQVRKENIGQLGPCWHIMKASPKTQHVAAEIEGFMITEIARKLLHGKEFVGSPCAKLYEKFRQVDTLQPSHVTEILDTPVA